MLSNPNPSPGTLARAAEDGACLYVPSKFFLLNYVRDVEDGELLLVIDGLTDAEARRGWVRVLAGDDSRVYITLVRHLWCM